ncbi:MAG: tyrosine recombinase XerC [Oscillospiraceae bacterium]|nr:tyrosine recombinase XerC [Oscillospiraceae bacterium]
MDYRNEVSPVLLDFLNYHEHIRSHSRKTIDEYFLDLRTFFRFMKLYRGLVPDSAPFEEISILDIDADFVKSIAVTDVYAFLNYLSRDRVQNQRSRSSAYGLSPTSRARKVATIRSFYKYLTTKVKLMEQNPMQDLDSPKSRRSLPKFLSLDECMQLLASIDGKYVERDFCIITLFLNCGLRISELIGLNLTDVRADYIRVVGKGDKERILYLNEACIDAVQNYLPVRELQRCKDKAALFVSRQGNRISRSTVHHIVKKYLLMAGLDSTQYSSHKLRHTAATLLLQSGVDVRTLQEVLGHDHLNTTQIYTHVDNNELRMAAKLSPLAGVRRSGAADGGPTEGEK